HPAHPGLLTLVGERLVDPRSPIGATGLAVDLGDGGSELGVSLLLGRRSGRTALIEGGTGDLEQAEAPCDAPTRELLRLDEGVHLHRVSFAKKLMARFKTSTSSRRDLFSLRRRDISSRSSVVRPCRLPASIWACSTHLRTEDSV